MSMIRLVVAPAVGPPNSRLIWPVAVPVVGRATVTEFGTTSLGAKLRLEVVVGPVSVPGRTATKPPPVGRNTVTLATMPVAPSGTGLPVPGWSPGRTIGMVPVTSRVRAVPLTSGPVSPMLMRVSSTRTGLIGTNDEGAPAALVTKIPAPPSVTATAAPTAAHRDLHNPRR